MKARCSRSVLPLLTAGFALAALVGCPGGDELPVAQVDAAVAVDAKGGSGAGGLSGQDGGGGSNGETGGSGGFGCGAAKDPLADACAAAVPVVQMLDAQGLACRCGPLGYYWNGNTCQAASGCACVSGCDRLYQSETVCAAAHVLCSRADGGDGGGVGTNEVWPADATKMIAEDRGGGFGGGPPPGSTCKGGATYTMTVADKNLAWRLCQASAPGQPYQFLDGQRLLTTAEMASVVGALDKVALSTKQMLCGADKPVLALKVTSPAGEKEYLDEFYTCMKQGVYVEQLDGLFQILRQLGK